MKRIGILTFHRAINYGACLQAYALKKYIKDQGNECDIIDYHCSAIEDFYNRVFLWEDSFKTKIKKVLTWSIQKKRNIRFKQFIEKNLLDAKFGDGYNKNNISETNELYDSFITGSDQVWSPFCTGGDLTYFLDFVKDSIKCNSYAACVGIAGDTFLKSQEVVSNLKRFNHISVREEIAQRKLSSILSDENREGISLDLDPTLLLSGEDWNKVATNVTEEHYIFVYSLSMPNEVVEFANKLAKSKHEKIIFCTLDNLFAMKNKNNTVNPSPEEFLGYIKNADYVVTNSFHGTVFSVIFKKVFFVIKNINPNHDNSRLTNVLSLLGLESQLVDGSFSPDNLEDIDYLDVGNKLEAMKKLSKAYINRIISE